LPFTQLPFNAGRVRSTGIQPELNYSPLTEGGVDPHSLLENGITGNGLPGLGGGNFNTLPSTGLNSRDTGLGTQQRVGSGLVQDLSRQAYDNRQGQRRQDTEFGTLSGSSHNAGLQRLPVNTGLQARSINPYLAPSQGTGNARRSLLSGAAAGNQADIGSLQFTPVPAVGTGLSPIGPSSSGTRIFP
jgi:hypothetical protein